MDLDRRIGKAANYVFEKNRVPFAVVAMVGNCTVLFTILWSYLFFHDPITIYIISGTLIFVAEFLLLNFPIPRRSAKKTGATR
jgi:drug/metabolite transporter (DMT)-like permease